MADRTPAERAAELYPAVPDEVVETTGPRIVLRERDAWVAGHAEGKAEGSEEGYRRGVSEGIAYVASLIEAELPKAAKLLRALAAGKE